MKMLQKLLISGIPSTGKTFIGNYLRDNKSFLHFNMEDENKFQELTKNPEKFINELSAKKQDAVITGGFQTSELAFNLVKKIIKAGFVFVWFGGNHQAARREFIKRNTVQIDLFNKKMNELEKNYSKIMELNPILINTFDNAGLFKTPEQINLEIDELIKKINKEK